MKVRKEPENCEQIMQVNVNLIPNFDSAVPATCDDLGCLVGQPEATDTDTIVSLEPGEYSGGLPVPSSQFAIRITRYHHTEMYIHGNIHYDRASMLG